ncbi:hypothetical protein GIB67_002207 [Kingdonia uniflora]|uniref:Uncharacterized protein n=1 Tax=Kingdonia uniflora TaxID=39325 RepID=A0A7J7KWS2_9MAGN|nr:hypothetical protein GIB67_002207 [Kingdonia uniflora]
MSVLARSEEVTMSVVRSREKLPTSRKPPKVEVTTPPIEELSIASLPVEEDVGVDGLSMVEDTAVVSSFPPLEGEDVGVVDGLQLTVVSAEAEVADIYNEGCVFNEEDFMMDDDVHLLPDIEASDGFHDMESFDDISQVNIDIEMETEQKPALIEATSSGRTNQRIGRTESERREWYLERRRIWRRNLPLEERRRDAERARIRRQSMSPEEKEKQRERRRLREAEYQQKYGKRQESEEQKERRRARDKIHQQRRQERNKAKVLSPIEEIEMEQKRLKIKERRKIRDSMRRENMSAEEWQEERRKINEKRRARDALRSQNGKGSDKSHSMRKVEKTEDQLALDDHNNNCSENTEEVKQTTSKRKRTRAVDLRQKARNPSDLLTIEGADRSDNDGISLPIEVGHLEVPFSRRVWLAVTGVVSHLWSSGPFHKIGDCALGFNIIIRKSSRSDHYSLSREEEIIDLCLASGKRTDEKITETTEMGLPSSSHLNMRFKIVLMKICGGLNSLSLVLVSDVDISDVERMVIHTQ